MPLLNLLSRTFLFIGITEFWLSAFRNCDIFADVIKVINLMMTIIITLSQARSSPTSSFVGG